MWIKNKAARIINNFLVDKPSHNSIGKISFSQSGEDIIIEYIFKLRNIQNPTFVDIGGFDPIDLNNTYKFFLKGSRGLNIDANPYAIERFKAKRASDINLNVGIGDHEGEFEFYIMDYEALNTFSAEEKENLLKLGNRLKEVRKIKMVTINKIFEKYFPNTQVDLVSIDAEGIDFQIIKSFDFSRYAPKVICIETINYTPDGTGTKRQDLCDYIEKQGYFEYANTNINSLFVNKEFWYAK